MAVFVQLDGKPLTIVGVMPAGLRVSGSRDACVDALAVPGVMGGEGRAASSAL